MGFLSCVSQKPVWDPATKTESDKIEKVQRKAARFVCNDYRRTSSVSSMIKSLDWPSLQQRRKCAKVIMMYRIVYRLIDIPTTVLIPTVSIKGQRYLVPYARTVIYQRSFFPSTIRLWNALDPCLTTCASLDHFKGEAQKIYFP